MTILPRSTHYQAIIFGLKVTIVSLLFCTQAQAQLAIIPRVYHKTFASGTLETISFRVTNSLKTDIPFKIKLVDIVKDENNTWLTIDTLSDQARDSLQPKLSCKTWFSNFKMPDNQIVPANGSIPVESQIQIPADANGHYTTGIMLVRAGVPEQTQTPYSLMIPIELTIASVLDLRPITLHSITPGIVDLEGRPGEVLNTSVSIIQNFTCPTQISCYTVDTPGNEAVNLSRMADKSCQTWIDSTSFPTASNPLSADPNVLTQVPIQINIPKNASQGQFTSLLRVSLFMDSNKMIPIHYSVYLPINVEITELPQKHTPKPNSIKIYNSGRYYLSQKYHDSVYSHFFSYSGQEYIYIESPVPMRITTPIKPTSAGGGIWHCHAYPNLIENNSRVKLDLLVEHFELGKIPAQEFTQIADLEIKLIPE